MKAVQHFTSTWQPDKQYERHAFHDSFRSTLGEIFDEIERRALQPEGKIFGAMQDIRQELGCARKRQCCSRCLEILKPDRVPTGDLCGLCYDDQRNGR